MARAASCFAFALVLAPMVAMASTPESAPDGEAKPAAEYVLRLAKALPGERDLDLYFAVDGGGVIRAFGRGPTYNRMPYTVDASGLKADNGSLAGTVKFTIPSDGYVPKGVDQLAAEFELRGRVADGAVTGEYSGRVGADAVRGVLTGTVGVPAPAATPLRLALQCEGVVPPPAGHKGGPGRLKIVFAVRDGQAYGVKLEPPGSIVDVGFGARATASDLRLADGRLTGTLTALIQHQGGTAATLTFTFDGAVIGPGAAGTIRVTSPDLPKPIVGRFVGSVTPGPGPAPTDCTASVVLHDALGPGAFLKLYVNLRDGRFTGGFAATPNYNNATHDLDVSGLTLAAGKVDGEVRVTIQPDPWVPKDRQPQPGVLRVTGAWTDSEFIGQYSGTLGGRAVRGPADGGLEPPVSPALTGKMTLKLENGLVGGSDWGNRAFLAMDLADGRVTGGKVSNNHTALSGTVDSGVVRLTADGLSGEVTATVAPGGGVTPGAYRFTFEGVCVGVMTAGRFTTFRDGQELKAGGFWAALPTAAGFPASAPVTAPAATQPGPPSVAP